MLIPAWNIEAVTGYKPLTTFWTDFSIADRFGKAAVLDTFNRAFDEWKSNCKYLTELVMVLNHKIWQHHEGNRDLASLYNDLWQKADVYAGETLRGDDLEYYFQVTD